MMLQQRHCHGCTIILGGEQEGREDDMTTGWRLQVENLRRLWKQRTPTEKSLLDSNKWNTNDLSCNFIKSEFSPGETILEFSEPVTDHESG